MSLSKANFLASLNTALRADDVAAVEAVLAAGPIPPWASPVRSVAPPR